MKTKEVLDKYRKLISGLLKAKPEYVRFFTSEHLPAVYNFKLVDFIKNYKPKEISEVEYFEPEKDKKGNETGKQIRYTRWNDWSEGKYVVTIGDQLLASFELYKMPHCCAILVSCKAFVSEKFRNKRVGTTLNSLRQDLGRLLGYSTLMCTDINQNTHQRKLLETNGWKDIHTVKNKRTGNLVHVSVVNL